MIINKQIYKYNRVVVFNVNKPTTTNNSNIRFACNYNGLLRASLFDVNNNLIASGLWTGYGNSSVETAFSFTYGNGLVPFVGKILVSGDLDSVSDIKSSNITYCTIPTIELGKFRNLKNLFIQGSNNIYGDIKYLPRKLATIDSWWCGSFAITGNWIDAPRTLKSINLILAGGTAFQVKGAPQDLPPNIEYFRVTNASLLNGTTLKGTFSNLPRSLKTLRIETSNNVNNFTLSGSFGDLPPELITFVGYSGFTYEAGTFSSLPRSLVDLAPNKAVTLSGNAIDLPRNLDSYVLTGSIIINGNVSDLPTVANTLEITSNSNTHGNLTGTINQLPKPASSLHLQNLGWTLTGNLSDLSRTSTKIIIYNLPNFSGIGTTNDLPKASNWIKIAQTNAIITGDVADINNPTAGLNELELHSNNAASALSGLVSNIPRTRLLLKIIDNGNIGGNIGDLKTGNVGGISYFTVKQSNATFIYTPGRLGVSPNNFGRLFEVSKGSSGFTSNEIDNMLIDLDNYNLIVESGGSRIVLEGNNKTRTSLSDAAVASLIAKKITITIN